MSHEPGHTLARVRGRPPLTPVTRSHVPLLSLGRARARDRQADANAMPRRARGIDKGHRAPPAPLRLDPPCVPVCLPGIRSGRVRLLAVCDETFRALAPPAVRNQEFTAGAVPGYVKVYGVSTLPGRT